MNSVFLSYSSQDYFFAEALAINLTENGLSIWRDVGSIRAGDDWRSSIEDGIRDSIAVVVALSGHSANSAYVTYEWAYAIGMGKPVVPVKLSQCQVHPKLEPTQYIDFSYPRALPWGELIERVKEVEAELEPAVSEAKAVPSAPIASAANSELAEQILAYLGERGYTMASFDRLRKRLAITLTDKQFDGFINQNVRLFRRAVLKGNKPGIAKRVP